MNRKWKRRETCRIKGKGDSRQEREREEAIPVRPTMPIFSLERMGGGDAAEDEIEIRAVPQLVLLRNNQLRYRRKEGGCRKE